MDEQLRLKNLPLPARWAWPPLGQDNKQVVTPVPPGSLRTCFSCMNEG
jgi:hypothetical protein